MLSHLIEIVAWAADVASNGWCRVRYYCRVAHNVASTVRIASASGAASSIQNPLWYKLPTSPSIYA